MRARVNPGSDRRPSRKQAADVQKLWRPHLHGGIRIQHPLLAHGRSGVLGTDLRKLWLLQIPQLRHLLGAHGTREKEKAERGHTRFDRENGRRNRVRHGLAKGAHDRRGDRIREEASLGTCLQPHSGTQLRDRLYQGRQPREGPLQPACRQGPVTGVRRVVVQHPIPNHSSTCPIAMKLLLERKTRWSSRCGRHSDKPPDSCELCSESVGLCS